MQKHSFSYKYIIASIISGAIFIYTLYRLDPKGGGVNVTLFLVSLFLFVTATFTAINFTISRRHSNNENHFATSRGSLRRGFLLGVYLIGFLGLSALELLTWWDALLLALSLILFELYFMSGKEKVN